MSRIQPYPVQSYSVQPSFRLPPIQQSPIQPSFQPRIQPSFQPQIQPSFQSRIQPSSQPRIQPVQSGLSKPLQYVNPTSPGNYGNGRVSNLPSLRSPRSERSPRSGRFSQNIVLPPPPPLRFNGQYSNRSLSPVPRFNDRARNPYQTGDFYQDQGRKQQIKYHDFTLPGTPEREGKYCDCITEVTAKHSPECARNKLWKKGRSKECPNPYAVCAKSTGTSSRRCGDLYDYEVMPDEYLISYANRSYDPKNLYNIVIPVPYNRRQMIDNIYRWKTQIGKY